MSVVQNLTSSEKRDVNVSTQTAPGRRVPARRLPLALQLLGALLVISAIVVGLFASHAGAAPLTNGTVAIKTGSGGAVANNPLAHQQVVDLAVAPNSTLSRSSLEAAGFPSGAVAIKVLECSDLGGQQANLPKKPTDCEPGTIDSISGAAPDGSLFIKGYTIYALPDPTDLGVPSGTICDDAEHQCVLGFFSNQNDFTKPHLFSGPFQVTAAAAAGGASTSTAGTASSGSATTGGASAAVSVPPATLADTGGPTLWPWLLGAGGVLLVVGSTLRYVRRPTRRAQP